MEPLYYRRQWHTATYTPTINERTSAEPNLVTLQSKAWAPPENGRIGRTKHVGATSPKRFNKFLSVLNVNVSWCFKVYVSAWVRLNSNYSNMHGATIKIKKFEFLFQPTMHNI